MFVVTLDIELPQKITSQVIME